MWQFNKVRSKGAAPPQFNGSSRKSKSFIQKLTLPVRLEGEWLSCHSPVKGRGASKRDTSMQEPSPQKAHRLSGPTSSLRIHRC